MPARTTWTHFSHCPERGCWWFNTVNVSVFESLILSWRQFSILAARTSLPLRKLVLEVESTLVLSPTLPYSPFNPTPHFPALTHFWELWWQAGKELPPVGSHQRQWDPWIKLAPGRDLERRPVEQVKPFLPTTAYRGKVCFLSALPTRGCTSYPAPARTHPNSTCLHFPSWLLKGSLDKTKSDFRARAEVREREDFLHRIGNT